MYTESMKILDLNTALLIWKAVRETLGIVDILLPGFFSWVVSNNGIEADKKAPTPHYSTQIQTETNASANNTD